MACDRCINCTLQARGSAFRAVTPSAALPAPLASGGLPPAVPTLGGVAAAAVVPTAAADAAAVASAPAAAATPSAGAQPQKPKTKRPRKPQGAAAKPATGPAAAAAAQQPPRRAAMTSKAAQSIRERAQGVTRSVFTVHILRQTVWDSVAFDVLIADTLGLRLSNMVTDV